MSMNGDVVTGWQNVTVNKNGSPHAHHATGRGYGDSDVDSGLSTVGSPRSRPHLNGRMPASPIIENNAVNVSQMQDSRRILAAFPFAAATPSAHGTCAVRVDNLFSNTFFATLFSYSAFE